MATAKSGMSSNMKITMRNGTAASAARSFVLGLMSIMVFQSAIAAILSFSHCFATGEGEMLRVCRVRSCGTHQIVSPSPAPGERRGPEGQRAHDGLADSGASDRKV